ncbi:hypothetical protein PYW08_010490 [Mythimna loreyi]|uniref:Uncharacterized protein n=1 Tax=Mythimna loreyi TaxID=667449 RepID=A0ACC2Q4P2_9NEOP|nr:hypothetical protein PYW08_010490 [Mythimna loreyi]
MCSTRVLGLFAMFVGLAESFSWDIVENFDTQLHFYNNGTLTHKEDLPSTEYIASITYDPVHHRVLFVDFSLKKSNMSINSFDISTRKIKRLATRETGSQSARVIYDPVTETIFWNEKYAIYSLPLNPASCNCNKSVDVNLLVKFQHYSTDIAVDSCGGYIYWITDSEIERIRLDGSEREVIINETVWSRISLVIDQQTQRLYWTERTLVNRDLRMHVKSAKLDGQDRTTLYTSNELRKNSANSLAVSKDFIYWKNYVYSGIWQLPKNPSQTHTVARKIDTISNTTCWPCQLLAAKYEIKEQIQGIKSCEGLQYLIPYDSKPESRVSICYNYCLQGNCSVSAEGLPKCSCKVGYSGERCELNACHKLCLNNGTCFLNEVDEPVCQCTEDYDGVRCEVPICKDYCLQGNCSVGANSQPVCSCKTGYSGDRCEVNACYEYHCLNGGFCALNEEDEPYCQCAGGYKGEKCEVPACEDDCASTERDTESRYDPSNYGESEVSTCHQYCLNGGVCSLDEKREPVCRCPADYEGERCDVPAFLIKCFLYAYKNVLPPVTVSKAVQSTCAVPAV